MPGNRFVATERIFHSVIFLKFFILEYEMYLKEGKTQASKEESETKETVAMRIGRIRERFV